jgi:hypothetical protein
MLIPHKMRVSPKSNKRQPIGESRHAKSKKD